jgi:polyribonucleotide nucleotidyltransferase
MNKIELQINNNTEIYDINKVAKQASGAVMMRVNSAVVLAAIAYDDEPVQGDFTPLTVQYIEKSYAAGKIPGGFIKREAKPSDFETLTSRIIDRSIRPLFPKGYRQPTQVTVMVLSSDPEVDMQMVGLNAASAALYLSDIPVNIPVCGVRVGKIDGELVVNPSLSTLGEKSTLDLYVAGTKEQLMMIEMRTFGSEEGSEQLINELTEDETVEALNFAAEAISKACHEYEEHFTPFKKADTVFALAEELIDEEIVAYVNEHCSEAIKEAITAMAKSERATELKAIRKKIKADAGEDRWSDEDIDRALGSVKRDAVRALIIEQGVRADGRGLKEVRPIDIETNLLPSVHGSCLFTRGQTQAIVTATLGSDQDAQTQESLTSGQYAENFMVHYNFPGFSVGEASRMGPVGRRELGHGNLAKRANEPAVPKSFNHTVRIVSEILESNGSSSMATVCGASLAMRAAGVPTKELVAGVAMGLVTEGERYAVLTDIMGLEDHDGDMDFKVAGTIDGITALQMDIKLGGISSEILQNALTQAREARLHILHLMEESADQIEINEGVLPSLEMFSVDPSKIVDIIGQGGKVIRELIDTFEVLIDLDRDEGLVKVQGAVKSKVNEAKEKILEIVSASSGRPGRGGPKKPTPKFEKGDTFRGEVKRIAPFGAFVGLPGDIDGLVHISKLSTKRVENVTDVVNVGDEVEVVVIGQKGHKIELALKSALDQQ